MIRLILRSPRSARGDWVEYGFGRRAASYPTRERAVEGALAKLRRHRRRTREGGEVVVREADGSATTIAV